MLCPSCGVDATGKFCGSCGAPLASTTCGSCRAPLRPGAKFCHRCGTSVGAAAANGAAGGNALPWSVAAIALLALIALAAGQRFARTPTTEPTEEPPAPIEYTVVEGDTWLGIAGAYGVDAESLAAYNGLTLDYLLQPGEVLTIPQ